jgi:parvulin-like peptidyl-prolyl isomerase
MLYWPRARQREETAANGAFSMNALRRFVLPSLCVALLAAGCSGGGGETAELESNDVAVVGGQQVSKEQFQALMARAEKSYSAQKRKFPKPGTREYENLKGQAVDFLVQRAEFEDEAADMGIHVSDKQVNDRIQKLIKQFYGGSEKKYEQTIAAQGLTKETAREEIRAQLISQDLYNKVTGDVDVTDKEIKDYYDQNRSIYVQKESRDVRHILVTKKALADQLYQQLKSGGDFAKLAKKYSKDPGSAQNGGRLTITRGQTVKEFDKTAFSLKKNQLAPPVHTQYGYHIIEALSDIRPAKTTSLDKVKPSIKQQLEQQKKQDSMQKWVDDVKKGFCKDDRIKYQVGYAPNPDPCAAILANTTSTTTATK